MIKALHLTHKAFGEMVIGPPTDAGENRRDVVAKWVRKHKPQEPGFTYTRRIVLIAPRSLVLDFLGTERIDESDLDRMRDSGLDGTGGTIHVKSTHDELAEVASVLSDVTDPGIREKATHAAALAAAQAVAREYKKAAAAARPPRPTAEQIPSARGRRSTSSGT